MIALIDYGAGNLTSVRKALATLGADFSTPRTPSDLGSTRGIIVPGVGHFAATRALDNGWRSAIGDAVARGASLFGICLGMQWLFDGSDEAPDVPGLGAVRGRCVRLTRRDATDSMRTSPTGPTGPTGPSSPNFKIPHVGWNSLELPRVTPLVAGVAPNAQVYFTHSYVAPVVPETVAVTTYGVPFSAAVERGRIAGVQFHPEKSGDVGLRILRNWLDAL